MLTRKELKDKMPYGSMGVVAKKAGVTPKTVSDFFAEKNNNVNVEMAALEILAEISQRKKALLSLIM